MKIYFPISTAIKKSLKNYSYSVFKQDILSALIVSLLALPLAMALSTAVGLPPQHGIYTAIIAGLIVPLLGGSLTQVTGPTAAFVVVLAPIVSEFGLRGIVWIGVIAGIILIILGCSKLGRVINYIPYPVTTGFTAGIAVVLATLSLNDFLGLGVENLNGSFINKLSIIMKNLSNTNIFDSIIGVLTLALLFVPIKKLKFIPSTVSAMLFACCIGTLFTNFGYDIATIGSKFSYLTNNGTTTLPGIPPYPPTLYIPTLAPNNLLTIPSFAEFKILLFPSITIAILAALESLLSATVVDSMCNTRHNPDSELNGLGIGNILSALALGLPATGAIARSALNVNSGGKTPISAAMHAVFIMVYILFFATQINYIPMAALSALLIYTAYRMSHYKQFIRTLNIATKSDSIVLITCFSLTIFIDMIAGVGIGIICAMLLLMKRIIEMTKVELGYQNGSDNINIINTYDIPKGTFIYRIRGPLFFGTIEKSFDLNSIDKNYINKFIIDITNVPFIDMTGLVAMKSTILSIANENCLVCIVCNTKNIEYKIKKKISGMSVEKYVYFYNNLEEAIQPDNVCNIVNKEALV